MEALLLKSAGSKTACFWAQTGHTPCCPVAGHCRWDAQRGTARSKKQLQAINVNTSLGAGFSISLDARISIFRIVWYKVLDFPVLFAKGSRFSVSFGTKLLIIHIAWLQGYWFSISFGPSLLVSAPFDIRILIFCPSYSIFDTVHRGFSRALCFLYRSFKRFSIFRIVQSKPQALSSLIQARFKKGVDRVCFSGTGMTSLNKIFSLFTFRGTVSRLSKHSNMIEICANKTTSTEESL